MHARVWCAIVNEDDHNDNVEDDVDEDDEEEDVYVIVDDT